MRKLLVLLAPLLIFACKPKRVENSELDRFGETNKEIVAARTNYCQAFAENKADLSQLEVKRHFGIGMFRWENRKDKERTKDLRELYKLAALSETLAIASARIAESYAAKEGSSADALRKVGQLAEDHAPTCKKIIDRCIFTTGELTKNCKKKYLHGYLGFSTFQANWETGTGIAFTDNTADKATQCTQAMRQIDETSMIAAFKEMEKVCAHNHFSLIPLSKGVNDLLLNETVRNNISSNPLYPKKVRYGLCLTEEDRIDEKRNEKTRDTWFPFLQWPLRMVVSAAVGITSVAASAPSFGTSLLLNLADEAVFLAVALVPVIAQYVHAETRMSRSQNLYGCTGANIVEARKRTVNLIIFSGISAIVGAVLGASLVSMEPMLMRWFQSGKTVLSRGKILFSTKLTEFFEPILNKVTGENKIKFIGSLVEFTNTQRGRIMSIKLPSPQQFMSIFEGVQRWVLNIIPKPKSQTVNRLFVTVKRAYQEILEDAGTKFKAFKDSVKESLPARVAQQIAQADTGIIGGIGNLTRSTKLKLDEALELAQRSQQAVTKKLGPHITKIRGDMADILATAKTTGGEFTAGQWKEFIEQNLAKLKVEPKKIPETARFLYRDLITNENVGIRTLEYATSRGTLGANYFREFSRIHAEVDKQIIGSAAAKSIATLTRMLHGHSLTVIAATQGIESKNAQTLAQEMTGLAESRSELEVFVANVWQQIAETGTFDPTPNY